MSALLLALCLIPATSCTSVVGVLVNPTSVSWQDVAVGAKGSLQTVTLTNLGGSTVSLSNIAISGANTRSFSIVSGTCGTTLAANASCTVSLLFAPTAAGPSQATFSFNDSAQSSPMAVPLSGVGTTSIGSAVANPSSLQFGAFNVGTSSPAQTITLQNQGTAPLSITSAALTGMNAGDFAISSNTCGTTLQGSGTCTISVVFTPSAAGTRSATVAITDNATNSPQTVSLTGTGNSGNASVMPASLSFANTAVGATTSPQSVTLANGGTASINIASIALSGANAGDFAISANTCGTALAGSGNCTVSVTFTPTAAGTRTATLTFTDSAGNSPQTVALSGTGTSSTANASVTPSSLTFAATNVSSTSSPQSVTLANAGTASINITSIAISGTNAGDFAISAKTCGTTLAGSGNCTVSVTFTPAAAGTRTATLTFTDSAGNSPQTVALSGTGTSSTANASVTPSSLTFAATNVSSTSSPQTVTLANAGTASINITSIAISGTNVGDFAISAKTCGTTLAGSGNCTVSVTFTPAAAGTRTATLTFTDSAGNSPQTVALTGTGTSTTANASVTPASLTFAATSVSSTSSPQTVTLANAGTASINITSIAISGTNSGDFAISAKTCGATLAGSGTCTVSVTFTPAAAGTRTATLTFTDSAGNSPQTVALTGTGTSSTANASVMPTSLSFANTPVGATSSPQTVTLTNGGTASINITSIAISGTNAGDFAISAKTCGTTLAGSGNCTVSVTFTPAASGTRTATLTFTDSATNSPQTVALTGNEVAFAIVPVNPTVVVNEMIQFSANAPATWTASCGILNNTATGLYTAPASPQTCTLTATENASPHSTASTQVTVVASSSGTFAVYPSTAAVPVSGEQVFQAQLAGAPDTNSLSYSVDGVAGGDSTSGTVTSQGLYTAPSSPGSHLLAVTDNSLGLTATASITVYSNVTVDFGSRASNTNPVPAGLFGAQYLESLHTTTDLALVEAGGITSGRTYAQITNVFATSTPNWGPLDATIKKITASGGVHVMLEMYQSPTWLQQGTCGVESMPSDVNAWASIAQQIVQHMDVTFPGVATDYEIWNEPDIALCVPAGDNALTDYIKLYSTAVPLMKAQAKTDGQTIRVGGPVTAGLDSTWVTAILNDPVVSQNIDFLSYHSYLVGKPGETAAWDTYNGTPSIYQITQGSESPANIYEYAGSLAAAGKQPQGENLPIYITEYNLDWLFVKTCCSDDYTYAPLWNALYVADLLDAPFAYTGAPNSISRLIYYAAANPPYYCLVGELDTNMDCAYPTGTPAQPYPQYFTYQLLGSPNYLDLQDGGYLAASISPARLENGLVVAAYFTPSLDAVVLINPTQYTYTNLPIDLANPGFTSPQATLYQIANGQSIQSSPLSLNATGGSSFTATVTLAPYSVQAIALH